MGVDPDSHQSVVDLAAVGVTRFAWRDSPVEAWHRSADVGRIRQGEMMRLNAATTRLVRGVIAAHTPAVLRSADARSALCRGTSRLFDAVNQAMASPDRRLPGGRTLAEMARGMGGQDPLNAHVRACCDYWSELAIQYDVATVLLMLATAGAGKCRNWWLAPHWRHRVDDFIRRLENPAHWKNPGVFDAIARLPRPPDATATDQLRKRLRAGPDLVSAAAADYCLRCGLGDGPLPVKPPDARRTLSILTVSLHPLGYEALPAGHPELLLRPAHRRLR